MLYEDDCREVFGTEAGRRLLAFLYFDNGIDGMAGDPSSPVYSICRARLGLVKDLLLHVEDSTEIMNLAPKYRDKYYRKGDA